MTDITGDWSGDERFQLRRHLATIRAYAERGIDETQPAVDREGFQRIQQSCRELTALVESTVDYAQLLPEATAPTTIDRVVISTDDPYLSAVLDTDAGRYGDVELVHATDRQALESALTEDVDWLLVDAVTTDGTGLDLVAELDAEQPAYALVSLYNDDRTAAALACSGVLSPTATGSTIDDAVQSHTDETAPTIAGFLTDQPAPPLADRLDSDGETRIDGDETELAAHIEDAEIEADCLCLDPAVFRQLSGAVIGQLRNPAPGRSRPVILVGSTDGDPYDRSWIPTLGSQRFRSAAPDLDGLVTQLLVQRSRQSEQRE